MLWSQKSYENNYNKFQYLLQYYKKEMRKLQELKHKYAIN